MIYLYTGTPGSGKSYHSIEDILGYLWTKRNVIANFPFIIKDKEKKKGWKDRYLYWDNENITVDNLVKKSFEMGWYGKEKRCLLIIDEAGAKFNSRDWNTDSKGRQQWINFFSQHRKLGYTIIIVTQDDRMIDRQIRNMAEYEIKHRVVNNVAIFKYLPIKIFAYVQYWYGSRQRLGAEFGIFKKRIAKRYDTMKLFEGTLKGIEVPDKKTIEPGKIELDQAQRVGVKGGPHDCTWSLAHLSVFKCFFIRVKNAILRSVKNN